MCHSSWQDTDVPRYSTMVPMMRDAHHFPLPTALHGVSRTLLSLILLTTPTAVLAHAGHGNEFQGGSATSQSTESIQVDAQTAQRLGIKVEPTTRQSLALSIKTTGQIETLPSKKVEVTAPVPGKVMELLVEPGASVKAGQPVAVIAAPELVELRVNAQEKQAEAEVDLQKAQADLKLAQENYERQRQIAAAEIEQASTEVKVAQEQYDRDRDLVKAGALPRRQMLESRSHLAEGKAQLTKALSRREVLQAEAELKHATSAVALAKSKLNLSQTNYQTRLQQLGTRANAKGLVTVTAPISGKVADREATLGQAFEDAGGKLMTILNDSQVFATANIYEKDLDKVRTGQQIRVKVASLPNRTFEGRITVIGAAVEGQTRVVPLKAALNNSGGQLVPGMFAELEVLTAQKPNPVLAVPSSAIVQANGKNIVYLQNGNAYQPVEVTLGETSGDKVEVKTGLFEGDLIVTQRATQLFAQSLRGSHHAEEPAKETAPTPPLSASPTPSWWAIASGGAIASGIFFLGLWAGRRTQQRPIPINYVESDIPTHEIQAHLGKNSQHPILSRSVAMGQSDEPHQPQ